MTRPRAELASLELPGWKAAVSWLAAALLAILFAVSGIWKITYPLDWAVRISELKFPESLSLAAALVFGIAETLGAALILTPRFRRVGAALIGLLLAAFMVYFAINYNALRGAECTCFPWVKRMVGPLFFVEDGALIALAALAAIWAKPVHGLRSAALILGVVVVYALVSYGVAAVRQTGTPAPASVQVDGAPYSLQHGKIVLFYFDPLCEHCRKASEKMAKLDWGATKSGGDSSGLAALCRHVPPRDRAEGGALQRSREVEGGLSIHRRARRGGARKRARKGGADPVRRRERAWGHAAETGLRQVATSPYSAASLNIS